MLQLHLWSVKTATWEHKLLENLSKEVRRSIEASDVGEFSAHGIEFMRRIYRGANGIGTDARDRACNVKSFRIAQFHFADDLVEPVVTQIRLDAVKARIFRIEL